MKRLLFVLAACGSKDPPPPTTISLDALCDPKYDQATFLRLEGYITLGERVLCNDGGCWLNLWPKTEYTNPNDAVWVQIQRGTEANRMAWLPPAYLTSSLKLYPMNGTVLHHGDRVRLIGTRGKDKDHPCYLAVSYIQDPQGFGTSPTDRANPTSDK